MKGVQYTDYEMILDTSSMEWVAVGYLIHILLSVMQASLAGVLIVAGLINVIFPNNAPLSKFFLFFGLAIDLDSQKIDPNKKRLFGVTQVVLGEALLFPFFLDVSYLVSAGAAALIIFFLIYTEMMVMQRSQPMPKFFASSFIVFAMLTSGFGVYESHDNLTFGVETAFKAKHHRDAEIAWQLANDPFSPKVGDQAPDFTLSSADGKSSHSLTDFLGQDKPVVLFFGANSCPAFSQGTLGINRIHDKYKNKVNFVGVYVKEPHPTDEWWLTPSTLMTELHQMEQSRAAVDIKQPTTFAERQFVAHRAHQNLLNDDITFLVDDLDNKVNNRWTGQPTRIYLISPAGEIIYNPGSGPYSFNPDYLEPELEKYLGKSD